jgi:lactoylglutathione lyase
MSSFYISAAQDPILTGLPVQGARFLHTMLRVKNLKSALAFYVGKLGMRLLRQQDFPEGRFTLAFVGYGAESDVTALELTENWDVDNYEPGNAFGHVAIGVPDLFQAVQVLSEAGVPVLRAPGPLKGLSSEVIAFLEDPDGYRVELIHRPAPKGDLA